MAIPELSDLRDSFAAQLDKDVGSLIRLHIKDSATRGRPGDWLRAMRRSSVVLIAASLESFLEDLVCTGVSHLADEGIAAGFYPREYRNWLFRQAAASNPLTEDSVNELRVLSIQLSTVLEPLSVRDLNLDKLRAQFSNPTPEMVDWIMRLLDRPKYTDHHIKVNGVKTNVRATLHELAKRRNDVAHGDFNEEPSIDDVQRLNKFARNLSTKVKNDVSKSVERCKSASGDFLAGGGVQGQFVI